MCDNLTSKNHELFSDVYYDIDTERKDLEPLFGDFYCKNDLENSFDEEHVSSENDFLSLSSILPPNPHFVMDFDDYVESEGSDESDDIDEFEENDFKVEGLYDFELFLEDSSQNNQEDFPKVPKKFIQTFSLYSFTQISRYTEKFTNSENVFQKLVKCIFFEKKTLRTFLKNYYHVSDSKLGYFSHSIQFCFDIITLEDFVFLVDSGITKEDNFLENVIISIILSNFSKERIRHNFDKLRYAFFSKKSNDRLKYQIMIQFLKKLSYDLLDKFLDDFSNIETKPVFSSYQLDKITRIIKKIQKDF